MSKIALVDDDRNILTSVSMTLETEGFDVDTYTDGQSALDAFSRSMPDLAILDIKMPRMDRMDLLQRLRQKSSLPVIFLTSKDDEIDEILGLRMGADDYVPSHFPSGFYLSASAHWCAAKMQMKETLSERKPKTPKFWYAASFRSTPCAILLHGKA